MAATTNRLLAPPWRQVILRSETLPTHASGGTFRARDAPSAPWAPQLARDYYSVLAAMWDYLRARGYPADEITRVVRLLEDAIKLATTPDRRRLGPKRAAIAGVRSRSLDPLQGMGLVSVPRAPD